MKTIIKVDGMKCGKCAERVTNILKNAGVDNVKVSLENKDVQVEYNENELSIEAVKSAIDDAGYTVLN